MKKLIAILLAILFAFSCGNTKRIAESEDIRTMRMVYDIQISEHQLDSIIVVDDLPSVLDMWFSNTYYDYETKQKIVKRTCIKINNQTETTYILTGENEPYNIKKRIVE